MMDVERQTTKPVNGSVPGEYYRPFRDIRRRSFMQERLEIPLMARILKLPKYKRLLEIGCGQGSALVTFDRICVPASLSGMDIDAELLDRAKKRVRSNRIQAELFQEDVRDMRFPDAAFDVVVDFGTCYHIRHPLKALKEIARVLAEGGIFVYETPLNQWLSHPVRSFGRHLPWKLVHDLKPHRRAILWASRIKSMTAEE